MVNATTTVMNKGVLVASKEDVAGRNIAEYIINRFEFAKTGNTFDDMPTFRKGPLLLVWTSKELIHADHLEGRFDNDFYVFLSKHRSERGIAALTAHTTGNFGSKTPLGGRPKEIAWTYPSLLKQYMKNLYKESDKVRSYQVTTEATHHGPTSISKPLLFIEIGSTEKEWNDEEAVRIVSETLMKTLSENIVNSKVAIAFGGGHYSSKFTEMLIGSDYTIASMASKHVLQQVDLFVVKQMIEKSVETVEYAIVDEKGLGSNREKILQLISSLRLSLIKV